MMRQDRRVRGGGVSESVTDLQAKDVFCDSR